MEMKVVSCSVISNSLRLHGPLSMEFSRQEYWSGLPCLPPGDLPNPGIELRSPHCRRILYHMSHQCHRDSLILRAGSLANEAHSISSVQFSSVVQSCPTLCDPMDCSTLGFPAAAKSLQSCPTLCNPIDGSPRGSSVPGILQARILKWVAISFSNA